MASVKRTRPEANKTYIVLHLIYRMWTLVMLSVPAHAILDIPQHIGRNVTSSVVYHLANERL
jgi:hypothetical protein